jgi:hypothetical protein
MAFGTLLTLFVVPTAYTLLAGRARQDAHVADAPPAQGPQITPQPGHAD